jgi:hypothetical protein
MGEAGQARAREHFTEARMLKETAELYGRVLSQGMPQHRQKE